MPDEPKKLRLLKVSKEGYEVGTGEARKGNRILIPHEAIVAVLHGLLSDEERQEEAGIDQGDRLGLIDAAHAARRQLAGLAWRLGVCSWNMDWRAIPFDANPFHKSD